MKEYLKFYDALLANRLITPIYKEVLSLIEREIDDKDNNKDDYLILLAILFSLNNDGNICMSLKEDILLDKWDKKLKGNKILLEDLNKLDHELYGYIENKSHQVIHDSLSKINESNLSMVIGKDKFFEIEDNWLYIRKNNYARNSLLKDIDRLFNLSFDNPPFDYKSVTDIFRLTKGQEEVIKNGINKNLIITGGPGTGKTTSILFLLLGLLLSREYDDVYLLAPSGKAASRMKDSIKGGLTSLNDICQKEHQDIIERISTLKRYTIHALLGVDASTGSFKHNRSHPLNSNSIYIIDEASMIDICLFASLLSSIPDNSRVFIMGDKDQLPSVDAGAVFGDLMNKKSLLDNGNIVKLGEAVRFEIGSPIYNLAKAINYEEEPLPKLDFLDESLAVQNNEKHIKNPVYYYLNPRDDIKEKDNIKIACYNFGKEYYASLQDMSTDLSPDNKEALKQLFFNSVKKASILTAENEGIRGVKHINELMKLAFIDKRKEPSYQGYYPGELMMVNTNNKLLDLANGDSGILVTFKDDKTLYFMIEKDSEIVKNEKYIPGKIFKLGGYLFYPFKLITRSEIDNAYAITIHKSQGSDYRNILVILPTKKGHPLLNRQIVYTAITRTKGDTYILSNNDRLLDAKNTIIERDTNIN